MPDPSTWTGSRRRYAIAPPTSNLPWCRLPFDTRIFAVSRQKQSPKKKKQKLKVKPKRKKDSRAKDSPKPPPSNSGGEPVDDTSPNKRRRVKAPPPWQVMTSKEAKKNITAEKKRRLKQQTTSVYEKPDNRHAATTTLSTTFLSPAESRFLNWKRFNPSTSIGDQQFVASMSSNLKLPESFGVPEVAFLGRSNVGKSSLLNQLTGGVGGDRARIGKTPGATAAVNWFHLLDPTRRRKPLLAWVDLPGFGYAKLSKTLQETIQQAAEHYLTHRKELALGLLLVDIRREPSEDDRGILAALYDMGLPIAVIATKVDKVSKAEREKQLAVIQSGLGLPEGQPLCVSSVTGEGCRLLWKIILDSCELAVDEFKEKYSEEPLHQEEYTELDVDELDQGSDSLAYDQGYDWIQGQAEFES